MRGTLKGLNINNHERKPMAESIDEGGLTIYRSDGSIEGSGRTICESDGAICESGCTIERKCILICESDSAFDRKDILIIKGLRVFVRRSVYTKTLTGSNVILRSWHLSCAFIIYADLDTAWY